MPMANEAIKTHIKSNKTILALVVFKAEIMTLLNSKQPNSWHKFYDC